MFAGFMFNHPIGGRFKNSPYFLINMDCLRCGEKILGKRKKKYCSSICRNRDKWSRKDKNKRLRAIKFREEIKKQGKCEICGWKEHPEILEFHHMKGEKKGRPFSHLITKPAFLKELKKCELICPNCHTYTHYIERKNNKNYNIPKYIQIQKMEKSIK